MSSIITAGAVALNLAGSFMPGSLPPASSQEEQTHNRTLHQIKPHLERHPNVFHGPNNQVHATTIKAPNSSSANWSGAVIMAGPGQYATTAVKMELVVPTTLAPFGSCVPGAGKQDFTAIWNGIDGSGNFTVEQAGIQFVNLDCGPPSIAPFIETYPNPEIGVTNFPISPGDVIVIWTWIDQASRVTCGAWENETKQSTTSACLIAPQSIEASSVEWVVERPQLGSTFATLSDYISTAIWFTLAYNYNAPNVIYGKAATSPQDLGQPGILWWITMLDDNNAAISTAWPRQPNTLIMKTSGSAYCAPGASCQPLN